MTSKMKQSWERMLEKRTVVAIPTPTAVNAWIMVPEMANTAGQDQRVIIFTESYWLACVNSQKEGSLLSQTMAMMITSCLINDRCAKQCMTTMTRSYHCISQHQLPPNQVVTDYLSSWTTAMAVTSCFKREWCDQLEFQNECYAEFQN